MLELGSAIVPFGLWKAIQEMRKDEQSLIMVKPKWGYNHPEFGDQVETPAGWEDRKAVLKSRRAFFEVTLLDWIVRHDLNADGNILKTIVQKGVGYDRPSPND